MTNEQAAAILRGDGIYDPKYFSEARALGAEVLEVLAMLELSGCFVSRVHGEVDVLLNGVLVTDRTFLDAARIHLRAAKAAKP